MILGGSVAGVFETLQTRKSPSEVCVASISVFCFEEDPCHASPVIGDGPLEVLRVCNMVNGCSVAIRMEPLRYLSIDVSNMSRRPTSGSTLLTLWQKYCSQLQARGL